MFRFTMATAIPGNQTVKMFTSITETSHLSSADQDEYKHATLLELRLSLI